MSDLDQHTDLPATLRGLGDVAGARAIVLVLHGGKEDSVAPTSQRQVAVLRMAPIARHLASVSRAGRAVGGLTGGLAVWRLRFRLRGWNSAAADPVDDVRWAIGELRQRHGDLPVLLVGHSMGGRAALRAADEPGVLGVVGLAPWLPADEPQRQVAGCRLLLLHGLSDRITSASASRSFVEEVRPIAAGAGFIGVRKSGHGMLRRAGLWNEFTGDFVRHVGLGTAVSAPLAQALAAGHLVV